MAEYKLEFSSGNIPYFEHSRVVGIPYSNKAFAISNGTLYELAFSSTSLPTIKSKRNSEYPLGDAKLLHVEPFDNDQTAIIVKIAEGIRIYVHSRDSLHLGAIDDQFHDAYEWNKPGNVIQFGHFYHDANILGMMSSHLTDGTRFYAIFKDVLLAGDFPIYPLDTNTDIFQTHSGSSSVRTLVNLKRNSRQSILSRSRDGLSLFELNEANGIDFVMAVPHCGSDAYDEGLFFADLTHQKYNDIVQFNTSGMFVYQYEDAYKLLHYNPLFSEEKGWTPDHTKTVRFEDVNRDGFVDMVFTGPKGTAAITYRKHSNSWEYLIQTSSLSPDMRHAAVMHVVPKVYDLLSDSYLITHHNGGIYFAKAVEASAAPPQVPNAPSHPSKVVPKSSMTPPLATSPTFFQGPPLLRDMNIWSDILNCVNRSTGQPKFSLPLVNLPEPGLKLILNYDATNGVNDVLGVGWTMPLNLIAMDDNGSVFEEDAVYVMAFQDSMQALKLLPQESTSTIRVYELPSNNENLKFRAKFHTNRNQWIVDLGNGLQQIYGQKQGSEEGAVANDIVWKNWHGPGFDSSNRMQRTRMWYLAEVLDERNNAVLEFFYHTDTVPVGSEMSYTNGVYMKKIRDYQGNEIEFRYQEKDPSEYQTYDAQDKDGNYNWTPIQSRYLQGYTFTTPSNERQTVNFSYSSSNGHRLLQEIHQAQDVWGHYVAKFEYMSLPNRKFGLTSARLPYDVQVDFKYAAIGERHMSKRIDISPDYKVTYGENYVLVSFIYGKAPDQVVLRMFNKDMTEELYTSDPRVKWTTKGRWPLLGEYKSVIAHDVLTGDNFFGVVLSYANSKWLCLCSQESEEWRMESKCHEYGQQAVIQAGKDFCLVSDPGSVVELHEWKSIQRTWHKQLIITNPDNIAIAVQKNRFLTYNNNKVSLGFRTKDGIWNHKTLATLPNCLSNTESILKRFNLREHIHKLLSAIFRNNMLKFSHNLVALSCLRINGKQLQSSLKLYTIDRLSKVSDQQEINIQQDDLQTFITEEEQDSEGNHFKYKYQVQSNGDFVIKLDSFRGPLAKNHNKSRMTKQIEKTLNSPAKRLLLDFRNYIMSFSDKVIVCRDQKIVFGGHHWITRTWTDNERKGDILSAPLGDKFLLEKLSKTDSVKLLDKKTRQVLSTLTVNMTDIRIFYPVYIATQAQGEALRLLEIHQDKVNEKILPASETLSPYSNALTLITHVGDDQKSVIFRQQHGIERFLPNHVVTELTVTFDNDWKKRVTGFEYEADTASLVGNTVVYTKCSIIPANDKALYGWLELSATDGSSTAFNNHGELVKHMPYEEKPPKDDPTSKEEEAFRKATTIYDSSGRLEIAQCAPYLVSDETVGYYGFEDYEINAIGTSKHWNFEASNVIRNGFSLTGRNYLHQETEPIEGVFEPTYQNIEYLASSWVRLQNVTEAPQVGQVTPYLKAIVLTESGKELVSLLSQVKLRLDDWIYLELIVDLDLARKTFEIDVERKLRIAIRVGPTLTTYIDIDHIRFAPLISDFQVHVFDTATFSNTAVIQSTGAIQRRIYDVYSSVVANINEENQIEELTVYTKAGGRQSPRCTVKVKPETGFYERFAPFSFANRWKITEVHPWRIAPYQLDHRGNDRNILELRTHDISTESYGFRLLYSLQGDHVSFVINDLVEVLKRADDYSIKGSAAPQSIPPNGEMLVVIERNRILVWIDGGLRIDQESNASGESLKLAMSGWMSIKDMMVFSKAFIGVLYQNGLDEPTQEISVESSESIVVKEKLYDELGRQRITTQGVRMTRSPSESLLGYIANFVTNDDTTQPSSVWRTGHLDGLAAKIIGHPYGFAETQYDSNPLNEKTVEALPGKDFSASGAFSKRFTSKMTNLFVANRFPLSLNVSYHVEVKPGDIEDITVLNRQKKKIAHFVHVPGGKDLFSTYKLNDDGSLLQSLPPLYFERVGSFHKTNSDLLNIREEDYQLQRKLGVHIEYDRRGNPIRKTTADAGPLENVYDSDDLLRFILYYSYASPRSVETIIYFTYDQVERLLSTGRLLDTGIPKDKLLSLTLSEENSEEFQSFNYADFERDPELRGRLLRSITMNSNEPFVEVMYVNARGAALEKRIVLPSLTIKPDEISISNRYMGGRLQQITYPARFMDRPFTVAYGYDRLGRVTSVGIPGEPGRFLRIAYNAAGQVTEETYEPASVYRFTNRRSYNEPGFLTKLEGPFQSEEISYTQSSYGGASRGDGLVTRMKFTSPWQEAVPSEGIGLGPDAFANDSISASDSQACFEALKQAGYLNDKNQQVKAFFPDLEIDFPIICTSGATGRHISNVLGRLGSPREHGYRFDYGAHQDLTKAKYFVATDEPDPFQPDTFATEIPGISTDSSRRIWNALKAGQFLIEDPDRTNQSSSHGKAGRRDFIASQLFADLREVSPDYAFYAEPIRKFLTFRYFKRQTHVTLLQIQEVIRKWLRNSSTKFVQRAAVDIFETLRQKRYFSSPLDAEFQNILKDFQQNFPDIVRVLFTYFGRQLGRSEFDVESYEIDANGNHRVFNTGFDHYGLKYERDSNRIERVLYKAFGTSRPEEAFQMKHDSRGNVIKALHKGIASMSYHPVSNLLQRVAMVDGRVVEFYYDSKGERVLKRLTLPNGKVGKEIHYLRDSGGRTLVERELSYLIDTQPPAVMVTMYIYGPSGLLGFVRRDQFYSVITDHQGSVRLIVRDGEVVAAYDYLPYGGFMRIFGNDPEAHIAYRYTGQEWDPEIGLYNYHARFYDPSIGRFYQIDPKEQYFSPYKYAGNSPVSMVDPSGEVAFLALAFMFIGAYLGAAAANDSLNFLEWDYGSLDTYIGMGFGALTGYFLPGGFAASAAFLAPYIGSTAAYATLVGIGLSTAYLSAAAANNSVDFRDWDFSARTLNALFSGFAMGATAIDGFRNVAQFYKQLDATGRKLFIGAYAVSGSGLFIMGGIATDWDLKKPQFWFATISSIAAAPDLAMFGVRGMRAAQRGWQNMKTVYKNYDSYVGEFFVLRRHYGRSISGAFMDIYKANPEIGKLMKMLGTTAAIGVSAYVGGSILNHGFTNWNMTAVSTYENLVTAIQLGGQAAGATKHGLRATKQKLRLRKAKDALLLTQEVAKLSAGAYKWHIESNAFQIQGQDYNAPTKAKLRDFEIPNTAVSVAIAGDKVMVGFSTNKAPGLYLVFDHQKLFNPTFIAEHVVDNNGMLAGTPVSSSDDPRLSSRVEESIAAVQDGIRDRNKQEYTVGNGRQVLLDRANSSPWVHEDVRNQFVDAIHAEIMRSGFVEKGVIQKMFDRTNFNSRNTRIEDINVEIDQVQNSIPTAANNEARTKLKADRDRLIAERKTLISNERRIFMDKLFEPVAHLREALTNWEISNCAEPHTLMILERQRAVWGEEYFKKNSYNIQHDIDYLATYRVVDVPAEIGFQRCDNCLHGTTQFVKNVLTDNDFMTNLQRSTDKAIERAKASNKHFQFLIPMINLQNTIENEEKRQNGGLRQKRSTPSRWYDRPLRWFKSFSGLPNNTSSTHDEFLSKIDVNGTLLLTDVILAKCQHRKVHQMTSDSSHEVNPVELLCNLLQLFEESVDEAAHISGTPLRGSDMDAYAMKQEIMPLLRRRQFEGIPDLMLWHAVKGLGSGVTSRQIDRFSLAFDSLNLNHTIQEMVFRVQAPTRSDKGIELAYRAAPRVEGMSNMIADMSYSSKLLT